MIRNKETIPPCGCQNCSCRRGALPLPWLRRPAGSCPLGLRPRSSPPSHNLEL